MSEPERVWTKDPVPDDDTYYILDVVDENGHTVEYIEWCEAGDVLPDGRSVLPVPSAERIAALERPAVRVFGRDRWHVFDLRTQLGIISATLHQRFVAGHSAGRIRGEDAVVSGFFATQGVLLYNDVTEEMRHRARASLARVQALHLAEKMVDEMSTGEARRVLIARALVSAPRALVLDEPTTGLDVVARHRFLESVRDIARYGTTIVLITHHVEEIIPEVQQVVLLDRGRVAAAGPPAEMLTDERLSAVFGAPVRVEHVGGYYQATAST